MSNRRSSRLASKGTPSSGNGGGGRADLIFEENSAQHVNLKTHTPRTPYQRSTQKRKRGLSASTAVTSVDVGASRMASEDGPSVFTQIRQTMVPEVLSRNVSLDPSSPFSPMSQGALFAIDQIENDAQGPENSSDAFGDGDGASILDILPNTPENVVETPRRSLKTGITSKRLTETAAAADGPEERKPLNEFQTAKAVLEKSVEQEKELESKRNMKRSSAGGDKSKKKAKISNQGHGAQGKKKKRKGKFKLAYTNRKDVRDKAADSVNENSLRVHNLSVLSSEEKLQLSNWGLPISVVNNYRSKGITSLFTWQLECFQNVKVLEGTNLLYSAPTSAGKTLVSEILMLKRVLELGRKAIMILPFVSVAREKVYSLQSIFGDAGVRVEGFMGSINPPGGFKAVDIAICTIEKANSLINKLLEENALGDLGTLVVDELHLIGDSNRGYLLELLLTKIIYMTSMKNNIAENSLDVSEGPSWRTKRSHIQVIGMSATLPNLDVLAKWLNAELYVTYFRPVPLKACFKLEDKLYCEKLELKRSVKTEAIPIQIKGDIEDIVYLSLETVLNGFSVLIFCSSRTLVEKIASTISFNFNKIGHDFSPQNAGVSNKLRNSLDTNRIKTVFEQLKQCPGGADKALCSTVMFGVGYHHAGLTYENRDIVESAFKRGILKVIVATSTLSAGVNLPARRVMIYSPMFGGGVLDTMVYHQMCGRAGRNGIDTEGESILLCPAQYQDVGKQLFRGEMPKVKSALVKDGSLTSSMKRALLEVIASGVALLTSDVKFYAKCTFLFHSLDAGVYESNELSLSQVHKESTVDDCLKYLEDNDFIRVTKYEQEDKPDEYMPTQLGSACLAASFAPDEGIMVYQELSRARANFVLENELHVIYQVTPIYVTESMRSINWDLYLKIFDNLDVSERKVAKLVGVSSNIIMRAMMGTVSWKNERHRRTMGIHQRFYAALALSDLVNEKSLNVVGEKFDLNKGTLQSLQTQASTFAGMVTAFCARLGWSNLELLLSQFQERLEFGVQRELCDLVRLDCLNGQRARILYDAGLKTIMELAGADAAKVEQILHKSTPYNSNVHQEGGEGQGKESSIWMIGKETLSEAEAAQKIVQEARVFIQIEVGNQGNIQFAFGKNDAPVLASKRQTQPSHSKVMKTSMVADESKTSEKQDNNIHSDEDVVDGVPENHPSKFSSNPYLSEIDGVVGNRRTVKEEKNVIMDEYFTQRQESEKSDVKLLENQNNLDDDELFQDSFPDMIPADISKVCSKYRSEVDAIAPKAFSISKEMEKVALSKSRDKLKAHDKQGIPEDMQNGHNETIGNNLQVQHSTPLIPTSSSKRQRFTLNQDGNTSPVPTVSPVKDKEKLREMNGKGPVVSECEVLELSQGILAELDNPFSSSVDCLESSVDFNAGIDNNAKKIVHFTEDEKKGNIVAKSESVRLNESLAAALQAYDEDTQFESEELFTDDGTNAAHKASEDVPSNVIVIPENAHCDDYDEEDFIMTQQYSEEELIDKVDDDAMFGDSSLESEATSTWSENSAFKQLILEDSSEIVVSEIKVGKTKITVKTVKSVDAMPATFFSGSEMIGVGMKLVSHKKPSGLSLARRGIGARVVGKNATMNNSILAQGESYHSLAAYNGRDTVWVLRWENDNGLRVGGSKKHPSNNNESPLDQLLGKVKDNRCALAIFDCKEKIKNLLKHCGSQVLRTLPQGKGIWDPRIAKWMWDFDDEDWNISKRKLIDEYVTEEEKAISNSDIEKEIVEALFVWKVMAALKKKLEENGLWNHFIETEMPSIVPLLLMEMNGLGLDSSQLNQLKRVLQFKSALLELKAFQIAGRQFNLNSSKDIKQILFRDIGLKQPKAKGTGKEVLLKLDHELPGIIVEWRKVNSALQKVVIPFQQERNLETGRVHGQYSHFTVTGRVVMSDPSLQCIPRDFDIMITYDPKELADIENNCRHRFGEKFSALFRQLDSSVVDVYYLNNISMISMRNAFVPCSSDFVILTADYSQLELRILAHLSGDAKLLEALNKGTDVFVEIASQWKKVSKDQVTSTMRQEAKGIVYGVIYGMGVRTLAEQMEIEEREATKFITQFYHTYPAIKSFIDKGSKKCLEKGYVETMTGRRRYLPNINSHQPQLKAKAGRQAVNTQIQGSAADLVKSAMTRIYSFLQTTYPKSAVPIEWNKLCKAQRSSISLQGPTTTTQIEDFVFFPILNLHDELIFEVRKTFLEEIAAVVKREMESCVSLNVKLPVVIKVGESWGNMKVYQSLDK